MNTETQTQNEARIAPAVTPLTDAQLRKNAPSIFSRTKHEARSDRYVHVPTIEVIEVLRKAGFVPVQAFQSQIKTDWEGRKMFAKHLIRLREQKFVDKAQDMKALIPDIILTNSHNGKCSFKLEAGLYRMVCSNGLIIMSEGFGELRVPHTGNIAETVKDGAKHLAKHVPEILRVTKEWEKIELTQTKRIAFAKKALEIRFNDNSPLTTAQVLEVRRNQDEGNSLWRTFNVIQENLLTGGVSGESKSGRKVTTRQVTGVNPMLRYNRSLWELAESIAKKA